MVTCVSPVSVCFILPVECILSINDINRTDFKDKVFAGQMCRAMKTGQPFLRDSLLTPGKEGMLGTEFLKGEP